MATFFKSSRLWNVDFSYDGHPRRWIKPLPAGEDGVTLITAELNDLYGRRVRIAEIRPATPEEELQYIRGEVPKNIYCPTGR
jgi:hypothetical protein